MTSVNLFAAVYHFAGNRYTPNVDLDSIDWRRRKKKKNIVEVNERTDGAAGSTDVTDHLRRGTRGG